MIIDLALISAVRTFTTKMDPDQSSSRQESPAPIEGSPGPQNNPDDEPSVITDSLSMHTAKRLKVEARKLDGMQRELFSLIGENQPPVVVNKSNNKFKSRPDWQQKATPWVLAEFEPKEGLNLKHWVRATALADGTSGDRFSKFNTEVQVPEWTDEDYKFFPNTGFPVETDTSAEQSETEKKDPENSGNETENKDETNNDDNEKERDAVSTTQPNNNKDQPEPVPWSLEETRYLFDLVKSYDIRWPVVADRYSFPGTHRSVDDLKERYYDVCRCLIKNRPIVKEMGLSPHDEEYLASINFSKENELKRKAHLERLLSRNPQEVAKEEALILEARRLEALSGRIAAEREELTKHLQSHYALNNKPKYDTSTSQGVGQLVQELLNEKSRKGGSQAAAATADSTKNVAQVVSKVLNRKLTERELMAYGISYTEAAKVKHSGVFIRSAKIAPIRQNILPKVKTVLNELGLPLKPVMPTAKLCAQYESLYHSVSTLLEAKKVQDKLEMEVDVLKKAKEKSITTDDNQISNTGDDVEMVDQ